jgi:hypothetical protein
LGGSKRRRHEFLLEARTLPASCPNRILGLFSRAKEHRKNQRQRERELILHLAVSADTDATKVARKIKHPLPSILYHIRPGLIGRHVDAGFRVLQWGNLEHDRRVEIQATAQRAAREADALLPNQMTDAVDILPCGFKIERTLSLTNLLGKPKTETFQCKTRWLDNRMQYGVKTSGNDDFPADCWADSPSAAFNKFRDREKLSKTKVISGPFLFGYPCFAVQQHLYMMRQSQAIEGPMKKKQRGGRAKLLK